MMRQCARHGCGEWFVQTNPKHIFCSDAHRAAQWKVKRNYGPQRPARENGSERRTNGTSGLQVSFRKAAVVLHRDDRFCISVEAAEAVLANALSDRQRAQWEARR